MNSNRTPRVSLPMLLKRSAGRTPWSESHGLYEPSPKKVFVNIPYDDRYRPLELALCTTIVAYDLIPVIAKATRRQVVRIDKIVRLIQACKYGVSDLSRPGRHNMSLEHGIMLSLQGPRAFVLCDNRFRVKRRLSDIEGFDAIAHGNSPSALIQKVSDWLLENAREDIPSMYRDIRPEMIEDALKLVRRHLPKYRHYSMLARDFELLSMQATQFR